MVGLEPTHCHSVRKKKLAFRSGRPRCRRSKGLAERERFVSIQRYVTLPADSVRLYARRKDGLLTVTRAVIAAVLVVASLVSCTNGTSHTVGGSPFVNPEVWVKDSNSVGRDVIQTFPGPTHCFSASTTFLVLGWPLGQSTSIWSARWYVRHPDDWLGPQLLSTFAVAVAPPTDATYTGYHSQTFELWFAQSDEDMAAYVRVGAEFERWPRAKQALMCE